MEALSETQKKQIKMFGCTTTQICEDISDVRNIKMFVMGMLSDVQEIVDSPNVDKETVRQNLNKAKYIIDNFMVKA